MHEYLFIAILFYGYWPWQWEMTISDPLHNPHPLTTDQQKFVTCDYVDDPLQP